MSFLKFKNSDTHYNLYCHYIPNKIVTIEGDLPEDEILFSGFVVADEEENGELKVINDFSDYTELWERSENKIVLSNDHKIYYTYFSTDDKGFVVNQEITNEDRGGDSLFRQGVGRTYQTPVPLRDEDTCFLYKVVGGVVSEVTPEEKTQWLADNFTFNTYFIAGELGFVTRYELTRDTIEDDHYVIYKTEVLPHREQYEEPKLMDENDQPNFKIKDGDIYETSTADKEAFEHLFDYGLYYVAEPETGLVTRTMIIRDVDATELDPNYYALIKSKHTRTGEIDSSDIELFDEVGFPKKKIENGIVKDTNQSDRDAEEARRQAEEEARVAKELEDAKAKKIAELRVTCGQMIVAGVDVSGSHYSYDTSDQANINSLVNLALKLDMDLPYHADGEDCRLFTKEEIITIYVTEQNNVTHHVTYNNMAKAMITAMETIEEVEAFKYGDALTGQYLENYNAMMAAAAAATQAFINGDQ